MLKKILSNNSKLKEKKGYTLTELLVAVGIIAVLCAIAIPSIISIHRSLAFKEANEYAEAVFMAAQDNITDMRSEGKLIDLLTLDNGAKSVSGIKDKDNEGFPVNDELTLDQYMYCTSEDAVFDLLLPEGSIDSYIRSKNILIEYNPYTGNIYSVFYCKKGGELEYANISRNEETRREMMLGYYCGSALATNPLTEDQTKATIGYTNDQEGTITVSIPIPDAYKTNQSAFRRGLEVKLTVTAETLNGTTVSGKTLAAGRSVTVTAKNSGNEDNSYYSKDGKSVVVEYKLDSLYNEASFASFGLYSGEIQTERVVDAHVENLAAVSETKALTDISSQSEFNILPGENVSIAADINFNSSNGKPSVNITAGTISGVNPMFDSLVPSPTDEGKYVITLKNGRQLQNLNAIAPAVANLVSSVIFEDDINWADTVDYYNEEYASGNTYLNTKEAPARALPYFVPINNESLFGTAQFIYPTDPDAGIKKLWNSIVEILQKYLNVNISQSSDTPALTDELDADVSSGKYQTITHANIQGNGHKIVNIRIDANKYDLGRNYYCGTQGANVDKFAGVFGYVNTSIDGLSIVNPSVRGAEFSGNNNPAAGALVGACGFNTLITNCNTYIDTTEASFQRGLLASGVSTQAKYNDEGNYYGVRGSGAVGGLVGYAKSHRTVTEELTDDEAHLAFSDCFAAIPVSGHMRGGEVSSGSGKYYGYTNGVGGLVGNAEISNFYNCYASGDVVADGIIVTNIPDETGAATGITNTINTIANNLGADNILNIDLFHNGRTSMGAGGFIGTSHGVRYTNCFATGDVSGTYATNLSSIELATLAKLGSGGFVGIMSYEETFSYGVDSANAAIAQQTVFQNTYAIGTAELNSSSAENFSGANCRIKFDNYSGTATKYWGGSYYTVYAPWWFKNNGKVSNGIERLPYESFIFKDSYYLSDYITHNTDNTNACAESLTYSELSKLVSNYNSDKWLKGRITNYKSKIASKGVNSIMSMFGIEEFLKNNGMSKYEEDVKNFINEKLPFITYGGIYFGDWVDQKVTYEYSKSTAEDWAAYELGISGHSMTYTNERYAVSGWYLSKGSLIAQAMIETSKDDNKNPVRWKNLLNGESKPANFDIAGWIEYDGKHWNNTLKDLYSIYLALYKEGFSDDEWENGNVSGESHSYNLNSSGNYPFAKLSGMDYYGRWPSQTLTCGLAYYELYEDGTYGYYFDRDTTSTLKNNIDVVSDGYAILSSDSNIEVTLDGESCSLTNDGTTCTLGGSSYHVYRLSWDDMQRTPKSGFYIKVLATISDKTTNEKKTHTMYFNPNAALTQVNPVSNGTSTSTTKPSTPKTIYIRTARQLAEVGAGLKSYAQSGKYSYTFQQLIDIDASEYTAETYSGASTIAANIKDLTSGFAAISGFTGTYTGTGGYVEKASISGFNIPVFKTIGSETNSKGTVEDVEVNINGGTFSSTGRTYTGLLAEQSYGTISNVDIIASGSVTINTKQYAGLLVGRNFGTVKNCTVNANDVTVITNTDSSKYIGGLIGRSNSGTVNNNKVTIGTIQCSNKSGTWGGGLVGYAEYTSFSDDTVTVNTKLYYRNYTGGFAGKTVESSTNACEVTFASGSAVTGANVAAGFVASSEGGTFTTPKVTIGGELKATVNKSTSNGIAAGLICNCSGTSTKDAAVTVSKGAGISAQNTAAGAVCTASDEASIGGTVYLNGTVNATSGSAAGYVVTANTTVKGAWVCMDGGTVTGTTSAAGVVCEANEDVNDCMLCGSGSVTSPKKAAGIGVTISGNAIGCYVTPVRHDLYDYTDTNGTDKLKQAYLNSDLSKLTISGSSAAGIGVDVTGTVQNCTSLGTVTGTSKSAGLVVNLPANGVVTGSMANTALPDNGKALIYSNAGSVTNCYAWYDGGSADAVCKDGETKSERYYACYFASLNETNVESASVLVCKGSSVEKISLNALAILDSNDLCPAGGDHYVANIWKTAGKDASYPFNSEIKPKNYAYPMLRQHYGDWVNPTQYAYGIAYYEKMSDGSVYMSLHDLSNTEFNQWKSNLTMDNLVAKDSGTIAETGYLVFYRNTTQILTDVEGDITTITDPFDVSKVDFSTMKLGDTTASDVKTKDTDGKEISVLADFAANYTFRQLKESVDFNNEVDSEKVKAYVLNGLDEGEHEYIPSFADAVFYNGNGNVGSYQIRTEKQFSNMGADFDSGVTKAKTYTQTHNFKFTVQPRSLWNRFTGNITYNGNGCTIDANNMTFAESSIFGNIGGDNTKAEIKSLTVKSAKLVSTTGSRGIFAVEVKKGSAITGCTIVDPTITMSYWGTKSVGFACHTGAFAATNSGTITNCTIKGSSNTSVFVIDASAAKLNQKSTLDGKQYTRAMNIGGIVGRNTTDGVIKDCEVKIDIIYKPATIGSTTTDLAQVVRLGGVVGLNEGDLTNTSDNQTRYNGDIVYDSLELSNDKNTVGLNSTVYMGGIVGENVGDNMSGTNLYVYGDVLYKEPHIASGKDNNSSNKNIDETVYVGGGVGKITLTTATATGGFGDKIRLLGGDDNTDKVDGKRVSNIGIVNSDTGYALGVKGSHYVGGMVGEVSGKIDASGTKTVKLECYATENDATVNVKCVPASVNTYVGGAIGEVYCGNLETYMACTVNSTVNANITVDSGNTNNLYVGGIVGSFEKNVSKDNQNITATHNGTITVNATAGTDDMDNDGSSFVGGAVGIIKCGILNASHTGAISAGSINSKYGYVGGLVGYAEDSSIGNNTASGDITVGGTPYYLNIGGVAGELYATTLNASYSGTITDNATVSYRNNVAGVAGQVKSSSTISGLTVSSFTVNAGALVDTAIADAQAYIGGIAGYVDSSNIKDSTVTGALNINQVVGNRTFAGGAVAKSGGGTYSNVTARVNISNIFSKGSVTDECPSGYATVGKFVGVASSSKFNTCKGFDNGTRNAYQFLGTMYGNTKSIANPLNGNYYTSPTVNANGYANMDSGTNYYIGIQTGINKGVRYDIVAQNVNSVFAFDTSELTSCAYYDNSGNTRYQTFGGEYYYNRAEEIPVTYKLGSEVTSLTNNGKYVVTNYWNNYALDVNTNTGKAVSAQFNTETSYVTDSIIWNHNDSKLYMTRSGSNYYLRYGAWTGILVETSTKDSYVAGYFLYPQYTNGYLQMGRHWTYYYSSLVFKDNGEITNVDKTEGAFENNEKVHLHFYTVVNSPYTRTTMTYANIANQFITSSTTP